LCAHVLLERGAGIPAEVSLIHALMALNDRHAQRGHNSSATFPVGAMVRRVLAHLHKEYARVVSLAELASLTEQRASRISRTFRAEVGLPPYAYLSLLRIQRARELLSRGLSLSVVAHEAGFSRPKPPDETIQAHRRNAAGSLRQATLQSAIKDLPAAFSLERSVAAVTMLLRQETQRTCEHER
jgi:transcriptional regulator GlxA family with amidase domain